MLPIGPIVASGSSQSNDDDEGARRDLFAQWATSAYRAGNDTPAEPVAAAARLPPQEAAALARAAAGVPDPDGRSSLVVQLDARAAAMQEQEHRITTAATFGSPLTGRHLREATQSQSLQLPPSLSLQLPPSVQPQTQPKPQG